jgi:acyl dehydratase
MNARPTWKAGDELEPTLLPPVDRLTLIKYAGASGDYNPIHTIDAAAEAAGLSGIIQHGMLTMAEVGVLFSPYLADGFVEHFHTRFVGMVFIGDQLRITGKVTGAEASEDVERYSFDLFVKTLDGRSIARSTLRFVWIP